MIQNQQMNVIGMRPRQISGIHFRQLQSFAPTRHNILFLVGTRPPRLAQRRIETPQPEMPRERTIEGRWGEVRGSS